MRLASYATDDGVDTWGVVSEKGVIDGSSIVASPDGTPIPHLRDLIERGPAVWDYLIGSAADDHAVRAFDTVRLRAPVIPPRDVFAVGVNYAAHARESRSSSNAELPTVPVIFSKALTSVSGPYDDIHWVPSLTSQLDYEVELAVVLGRGGRSIPQDQALDHVFGYMVANDVSARDVQHGRPQGQWFLGKSIDTCCPVGPWIVTADEIGSPQELDLTLQVNGEHRQASNTRDMIFPVADLIAEISRYVSLLPGDIIVSGTPSGVGAAMDPPQFLKAGDVIEAEIQGIGTIRNTVVQVDG